LGILTSSEFSFCNDFSNSHWEYTVLLIAALLQNR
jgi:hypothetical protein